MQQHLRLRHGAVKLEKHPNRMLACNRHESPIYVLPIATHPTEATL
jgi:hypothetical protein